MAHPLSANASFKKNNTLKIKEILIVADKVYAVLYAKLYAKKNAGKMQKKLIALIAAALAATLATPTGAQETPFSCAKPYVVDGDTLHCGKVKIRLYAIDAPELHGCPRGKRCVAGDAVAAREYLQGLVEGGVVCRHMNFDNYGRSVADCSSKQTKSLSCAMVAAGHAVERYGMLECE